MTAEGLKALRERLGLTRQQLAEELDIDPHHVYMLESGRRQITRILELAVTHLGCKKRRHKVRSER